MNRVHPYALRRRVVMLTTDVMIDRRILHEGETLAGAGYEVILLAGSGAALPTHEILGRVKVHRVDGAAYLRFAPLARFGIRIRDRVGRLMRPPPAFPDARASTVGGQSRKPLPLGRQANRAFEARLVLAWGLRALRYVTAKVFHGCVRPLLSRVDRLSLLERGYLSEGLFYRPDIIHVHDLPMLAVGVALKARLHVPLVYDMHESYPDQPRLTPRLRRRLRRLERKHIGAADVAISVNDLLLEVIRARYQLKRCGVVQNAVRAPQFDPERRYDRFRADYPQLQGKLLILFQGYIAPERNLEMAVHAMARVRRTDLVLLIMGYGEYAQTLEELADAQGVTDRVLLVPAKPQDELLSYSASADVGLIPYSTRRDLNTRLASPNKLYEFIKARLPILTNRLPFVERVVTQWGFGTVADLDDVDSFAGALEGIERWQLSACRERLARDGWRFAWEQEEAHLLKLYEALPGQSEPGAAVPVTLARQ